MKTKLKILFIILFLGLFYSSCGDSSPTPKDVEAWLQNSNNLQTFNNKLNENKALIESKITTYDELNRNDGGKAGYNDRFRIKYEEATHYYSYSTVPFFETIFPPKFSKKLFLPTKTEDEYLKALQSGKLIEPTKGVLYLPFYDVGFAENMLVQIGVDSSLANSLVKDRVIIKGTFGDKGEITKWELEEYCSALKPWNGDYYYNSGSVYECYKCGNNEYRETSCSGSTETSYTCENGDWSTSTRDYSCSGCTGKSQCYKTVDEICYTSAYDRDGKPVQGRPYTCGTKQVSDGRSCSC